LPSPTPPPAAGTQPTCHRHNPADHNDNGLSRFCRQHGNRQTAMAPWPEPIRRHLHETAPGFMLPEVACGLAGVDAESEAARRRAPDKPAQRRLWLDQVSEIAKQGTRCLPRSSGGVC
jgi:hypothetical protein